MIKLKKNKKKNTIVMKKKTKKAKSLELGRPAS